MFVNRCRQLDQGEEGGEIDEAKDTIAKEGSMLDLQT